MDPRIARLIDEKEIRDVLYRYCRGIDRRDLDLVRSCYHDDATDDHGSFSGGIDAYLEWVDGLLARYTWTMHLLGNILVEFPGAEPDPAKVGVAAAESYGVALHRSQEDKPYLNLANGFRYLDRFENRGSGWRIAARVAVSEWSMRIPNDVWWEIPESMTIGRRDTNDALYALLSAVGKN